MLITEAALAIPPIFPDKSEFLGACGARFVWVSLTNRIVRLSAAKEELKSPARRTTVKKMRAFVGIISVFVWVKINLYPKRRCHRGVKRL